MGGPGLNLPWKRKAHCLSSKRRKLSLMHPDVIPGYSYAMSNPDASGSPQEGQEGTLLTHHPY